LTGEVEVGFGVTGLLIQILWYIKGPDGPGIKLAEERDRRILLGLVG